MVAHYKQALNLSQFLQKSIIAMVYPLPEWQPAKYVSSEWSLR